MGSGPGLWLSQGMKTIDSDHDKGRAARQGATSLNRC